MVLLQKKNVTVKTIQLWTQATEDVTDAMMDNMARDKDGFNPVYMMAISGARGNKQQIRQLAGMRGLMADPSGRNHRLANQSKL